MINYKILDAWEAKYLKKLKDKELLAWSDAEAIYKYPKLKWVYDKYLLHKHLNMVPTLDLWDETPKEYPTFIKPRINLNGMGFKSGVIESVFDIYDKGVIGTHIAQPILTGLHLSTDLVWDNKKLIDYFTFECIHINGSFVLFESKNKKPSISLLRKLSKIGKGRRVMNVETIGGLPLELHLRPSVQFYDISGGLLAQLPNFIKTGKWTTVKREKTYSRVYRSPLDCRMARPRPLPKPEKGIRSVQFCWEGQKRLSKHTNDPNTFRYMVINGSNIHAIEDYARKLNELIIVYP